ncbi:MAG TPA: ABC transporter permease, partial [Arthrobacter sp.]|nr:ABC transporter permease [Arthrobacter sp.]
MSVLARSIGNAFRNKVRTAAVVAVLAVAIGLALAMLVANQAVAGKVAELNASVGTVLTVNPAGGQGFEGGGEPLTAEQAATAAAVPDVSTVVGTKALRLRNATAAAAQTGAGGPGGQGGQGGPGSQSATTVTTSLTAAVDAGTLGTRNQAAEGTTGASGTATAAPAFSVPVTATGIGAEVDTTGKALELTQGTGLGDYTVASTGALLGTTLAEKNGLSVGSTFTVKDQSFTVAGLFDAGTAFGNNALYLTLPTAQTLAELPGELSTMIVTVNSLENVDAAKTALQAALGTDAADVSQGERNLETAVSSLGSVKNISFIAF